MEGREGRKKFKKWMAWGGHIPLTLKYCRLIKFLDLDAKTVHALTKNKPPKSIEDIGILDKKYTNILAESASYKDGF